MTTPSLSFLTGTENLGLVFRDSSQTNVKFIDFNIPLSNSANRFSFNLGGKLKTFVIQGATNGDGWDGATTELKLQDFISTMDTFIDNDGEQLTTTYTNSIGLSYIVDIVDWQWSKSRDDPNRILYTLIMKRTA
jgi:hypothetical protein